VKPHITLLTLGVSDLQRAVDLDRQQRMQM
jgi:hypothetical protein